ncbi:MAG: SGNH/GDSL hydrolase family protein [Cyanobacteria bacterium SBLK]|nr:SGNH/GDSL hydrolase family protein [Cyanobacteria bacterium SBLK]
MKIVRIGKVTLAVLLSILVTEIGLRFFFGLGTPPLVQFDSEMGYRFQPNQKMRRFGNWVEYNQYSQRSGAIAHLKKEGVLRILMLGDSVLNGGNRTDQKETISEQLEIRLTERGREVEVLNASANSWGIGNQLGYLKKFGLFDADAIILQIGTHDLVQPTSPGKNLHPTEYPSSAIAELLNSYLLPRLSRFLRAKAIANDEFLEAQFTENLQYLQAIAALVRDSDLPLFVVYTPSREDLLPTPNNPLYKTQFFQFLQEKEIAAIDVHGFWREIPSETVQSYFLDWAHLTPEGQYSIAELVFKNLERRSLLEK